MTERNSIYTFKTELSLSRNELIDRIQQQANHSGLDVIDMLNSSSRRYPLAVRNSLRVANDLENVQKFDGQYLGIADMIESELYSRILSDEFKCKNQTVLYERKSGQKASIEGKGRVDNRHGAYFALLFLNHQVCLAHLLRELQYLSELKSRQKWSERVADLFRKAIHERNQRHSSPI